MNKKILAATALALAFYPIAAFSGALPQGSGYDNRVKTVSYNPDDVYRIKVRLGTATLIQLSEGERVESDNAGLGIGDSEGWTIAVRGRNIFMKPKAESPDTNITLVTNKRTYAFSLESVEKSALAAYIVRFNYPEAERNRRLQEEEEERKEEMKKRLACTDVPAPASEHINLDYVGWGDKSLTPAFIWDDGRFTCMKYPRDDELPNIYRITGDGKEAIVNSHMEDDVVVIHDTAKEFRLRLGDSVMGVKTHDGNNATFNNKNTSTPGLIRENIENE